VVLRGLRWRLLCEVALLVFECLFLLLWAECLVLLWPAEGLVQLGVEDLGLGSMGCCLWCLDGGYVEVLIVEGAGCPILRVEAETEGQRQRHFALALVPFL